MWNCQKKKKFPHNAGAVTDLNTFFIMLDKYWITRILLHNAGCSKPIFYVMPIFPQRPYSIQWTSCIFFITTPSPFILSFSVAFLSLYLHPWKERERGRGKYGKVSSRCSKESLHDISKGRENNFRSVLCLKTVPWRNMKRSHAFHQREWNWCFSWVIFIFCLTLIRQWIW